MTVHELCAALGIKVRVITPGTNNTLFGFNVPSEDEEWRCWIANEQKAEARALTHLRTKIDKALLPNESRDERLKRLLRDVMETMEGS